MTYVCMNVTLKNSSSLGLAVPEPENSEVLIKWVWMDPGMSFLEKSLQ